VQFAQPVAATPRPAGVPSLADRLHCPAAEAHMNTRLLITLCLGAFLVALAACSLRSSGLGVASATVALQQLEPLR
jgi:hypothetical protein